MNKSLLVTLISFSLTLHAAPGEVYKTVKEDGTVVYTDTPSKQSEPVTFDAHTSNVTKAIPVPQSQNQQQNTQSQSRPQPEYNIAITQPEPEATVRNNNGAMTISALATPRSSGTFQLTMDGNITKSSASATFSLSGVERGAHTFSIQLLNNKGKTLASSKEQTFYMHQASALINNKGGQ